MRIGLFITLIVVFCLTICEQVHSDCNRKPPDNLPTYIIDLDDEPENRFVKVAEDYRDEILALVGFFKKKFNPTIASLIEKITAEIDNVLPYPFNLEMKGIAKAANLNLGDVVIATLIYDITAFCTSIVTVQSNGKVIHARNLDYDPQNILLNMTYKARYVRDGELLFTSIQTAGYVGILTGHKQNAFTFSIDERDKGDWWENLLFAILDRRAQPLSFLTRKTMENATDFASAVKTLTTWDMIAPAYFIVGGVKPYEGVVITRSQHEILDLWWLNSTRSSAGSWYLVETNYDHWVAPPKDDDRITPAINAMDRLGQNGINSDTLVDVLTKNPICNSETVYTAYMSAADDDSSIRVYKR